MLFQAFKKDGLISKFPKILKMFKAYKKGEFQMDLKNVIIPLAAFLYIISPLDFLPGIFLDDSGIVRNGFTDGFERSRPIYHLGKRKKCGKER